MEQSKTYNNGAILEYTYSVIPLSGAAIKKSIFVEVATGLILDPPPFNLVLDEGSQDSFQGICCSTVIEEECEGWITNIEAWWVTEAGESWAVG